MRDVSAKGNRSDDAPVDYRELLEAAQRQADELALIERVQLAISSSLDLGEVLSQIAEQLCRALNCTSSYIARFDPLTHTAMVLAEYVSPAASPEERVSDVGATYQFDGDLAEALRSQHPIVYRIDDPQIHPYVRAHMIAYGGKSAIDLPIIFGDEPIAYASIWETRRLRDFSVEELRLGQQIARHAAVALQNARLYQQAQQEIEERARAEAALRQSEQRYRALVEAIPDALLRLNRQGVYLYAKDDKNNSLIAPPEQLVGRSLAEFLPPEGVQPVLARVAEALASGEVVQYEYQLDQQGERRDFEGRMVAYGDDEALMIVRDITQRKALDRELIAAREAALEASRLKSTFLANVSHEIRTPMNGVIGMLDLLLQSPLSEEQRAHARIARSSSTALLALLNDILDLSKIEAGKLSIQPQPFDLRLLVGDVLDLFAEQASASELRLSASLSPRLPPLLVGDPVRLRQVLVNLVGNALKFTPDGSVEVRAQAEPGQASPRWVRFEVADTGIGLSEGEQARLFQPFSQIDPSSTRRYSGSGLGLAISRQLVELMGGEIGVTGRLGTGATFWFRLPLDLPAPSDVPQQQATLPPSAHPLLRGRVLVVEDHPVNQLLMREQLARLNCPADIVPTGRDALKALAQRDYALVLMDLQMPELDGFATTAEIRRRWSDRHTPIVALTAHALHGDRERCLAAGMDDYLAKPVTLEMLAALLSRWLAPAGEQARAASPDDAVAALDPEVVEQLRLLSDAGQPSVLAEIIQLFLEDTPERMRALREAVLAEDTAARCEIAHSLKGSSANLGARIMVLLCRQFEALDPGTALPEVTRTLERLEREYARVCRELLAEQAREHERGSGAV
jgi:PAS domain S-box-containing protein